MVAAGCGTVGPVDADAALLARLRRLEEDLLRPAVRRSRAALEALLAPDFVEIGRSGRVYDREAIVAALAIEDAGAATAVAGVEDFTVRVLAPGVALATYRSLHADPGGRAPVVARRSSIWRRDADGAWRMTFHQGTPAG